MSSLPLAKRRRINNASHTLSQPFKSPFKTPLKPETDTQTNASPSPTKDDPLKGIIPDDSVPPTTPQPTTTHYRRPLPKPNCSTPHTIEYLNLQKRHTHLLNRLSTARSTLETSTQALKIESSNRDPELHALIQKWKVASRAAAEEVFAKARDRVNRMGGVGALRERERESKDRGWGWDDERKDGEGKREGEGKVGERNQREEDVEKVDEEVGGDDEGYTMDMMLKALNIELEVIGYDKGAQKWVD